MHQDPTLNSKYLWVIFVISAEFTQMGNYSILIELQPVAPVFISFTIDNLRISHNESGMEANIRVLVT